MSRTLFILGAIAFRATQSNAASDWTVLLGSGMQIVCFGCEFEEHQVLPWSRNVIRIKPATAVSQWPSPRTARATYGNVHMPHDEVFWQGIAPAGQCAPLSQGSCRIERHAYNNN